MSDFKRIYYRLSIENVSPLSVGSGGNEDTDHDILTDRYGKPFIPATAIAGVMRSYIGNEDSLGDKIFGYEPDGKDEGKNRKARPCNIRVYDAITDKDQSEGKKGSFFITTRDQVALQDKVGKDGAKFDMQALEPGYRFTAYIELLSGENNAEAETEKALAAFNNGEIALGTKTNRGYGRIRIAAEKKIINSAEDYIDFNMYSSVYDMPVDLNARSAEYEISLELVGGISIREYYTDAHTEKNDSVPDYGQMTLSDDTPVIPGTSWAGMFRSRFTEFTDEEKRDKLFGYVDEKTKKTQPSRIKFSESELKDGVWKVTTRNSIDRFSGATKDGALYTERTYYYGKTVLRVGLDAKEVTEDDRIILGYCLADLNEGFLALGGLTSVGRGLFRITGIRQGDRELKDISPDNIIAFMKGGADNG